MGSLLKIENENRKLIRKPLHIERNGWVFVCKSSFHCIQIPAHWRTLRVVVLFFASLSFWPRNPKNCIILACSMFIQYEQISLLELWRSFSSLVCVRFVQPQLFFLCLCHRTTFVYTPLLDSVLCFICFGMRTRENTVNERSLCPFSCFAEIAAFDLYI